GDFFFSRSCGARWVPAGQRTNIFGVDEAIVFMAQEIFEQNLQREGKPRGLADAGAFESVEAVDFKGVAANFECGAGGEGIFGRWTHASSNSPVRTTRYCNAGAGSGSSNLEEAGKQGGTESDADPLQDAD